MHEKPLPGVDTLEFYFLMGGPPADPMVFDDDDVLPAHPDDDHRFSGTFSTPPDSEIPF